MIGYIIGAAIVGLVIGVVLMFIYCNISKQTVNDAKREAESIKNEAEESAARKKREALLEAKEEIHKNRADLEREIKERRGEMSKTERRLTQKEETLDRKTDAADKKNEELTRRLANVQKSREEAEQYKQQQLERLESISGLTRDEAKQYLVDSIEQEAQHDAAIKLREIQQQTKDDAEKYAREVISSAIQRCAADHVAEATVSVVPLPNDEMKGRIIGREGRNIRTLETLTGVDLIIDDTPEAITLSCFDPVRREVARLTLEKLIIDGRIHPARIEEMVEKSRREVDQIIKQEGERAVLETGVHGLHPELVKQWHPTLNGDLTPDMVTPGTRKRAWWICPEGHVWNCAISSRTAGRRPSGCPVCAGNAKENPRYEAVLRACPEQESRRRGGSDGFDPLACGTAEAQPGGVRTDGRSA